MVALTQKLNLPLDHPIEIAPDDQRLETLRDVGTYILALPETVKRQQWWRAAAEIVLEAAESGDTARVAFVVHLALIMSGQTARSVSEQWGDRQPDLNISPAVEGSQTNPQADAISNTIQITGITITLVA